MALQLLPVRGGEIEYRPDSSGAVAVRSFELLVSDSRVAAPMAVVAGGVAGEGEERQSKCVVRDVSAHRGGRGRRGARSLGRAAMAQRCGSDRRLLT